MLIIIRCLKNYDDQYIILILCDMYPLVRCRKFWKSTNWGAIQHLRSLFYIKSTWAKTYGTWDTNKWKAIVFTDECVIESYSSTRKVRINIHWSNIHVWGCFTNGNRNAEKYQKDILHDMHIVGKYLVFPE